MQALVKEELVSLEEYIALDEASPVKLEYWAGRVFEKDGAEIGSDLSMAGGTPTHTDLIGNVTAAFVSRLRGKRCRGSSSEQRIRIEASDVEFYPDFVVKCPPEQYSPLDPHALSNPALIVEVLSPGSEKDDRGEKFKQYSLIPELHDYLLISQDKVLVEHFQRGQQDEWILRRFNAREDVVPLPHLEIEVPLSEIYDGLDLPSGFVITRS
jgi:Uma2 family endonuclease